MTYEAPSIVYVGRVQDVILGNMSKCCDADNETPLH